MVTLEQLVKNQKWNEMSDIQIIKTFFDLNNMGGLYIEPDGIHCMVCDNVINEFEGIITKKNTVAFADGEYECDVTMLYPGSVLREDGILISKDGEEIDLNGLPVKVSISMDKLHMSDDENAGGVCGHIISLIYKGDHYNYIIKTKNGYEYMLDDEYLWNENDYVSLVCAKEDIHISLMEMEV